MKLLQNILSVVDLKESSEHVMKTSIYLAQQFNSSITILHVMEDENINGAIKQMVTETVNRKLKELSDRVEAAGIHVKQCIIETGVPFEKIIQEGQNNEYNVIVAGSGSKHADDPYKLGTTVEKLIRKNQVPLWVVKNNTGPIVKRILCSVDFSDASKRAFSNALTLAEKLDAELHLLSVYTPVNIVSSRLQVDNAEENNTLRAAHEKQLHQFLESFNYKNVRLRINITDGEAYKEIISYVANHNIDLLLMGTTGKTVLSRLLMGSVTEKVTRQLPCSFITTKAKDITDTYFESNLKSVEILLNAANTLLANENYEKAIEKYSLALKHYPDNIPVLKGLIQSYKGIGNKNMANLYTSYAREIIIRTWGEEYIDKIGL